MEIVYFACAGLLAHILDGAIGMAYGVTCNSVLLTVGYPPAAASASVHLAEIATSGLSGHFHSRVGNVDRTLFRTLVLPGVLGGVSGAWILTSVSGEAVRPWIAAYLALMGVRILYAALRVRTVIVPRVARLRWLGFVGGVMDAIGGGGWGPVVTTTLVGRGHDPRIAIGSANCAEFFVTFAQSLVFAFSLTVFDWQVILGLSLGGLIGAPLGAYLTRWLSARALRTLVGMLIIVVSIRTIVMWFGAH